MKICIILILISVLCIISCQSDSIEIKTEKTDLDSMFSGKGCIDTKFVKGCYFDSIPCGTWRYFDIDGRIIKEVTYKDCNNKEDGIYETVRIYDSNNRLLAEEYRMKDSAYCLFDVSVADDVDAVEYGYRLYKTNCKSCHDLNRDMPPNETASKKWTKQLFEKKFTEKKNITQHNEVKKISKYKLDKISEYLNHQKETGGVLH